MLIADCKCLDTSPLAAVPFGSPFSRYKRDVAVKVRIGDGATFGLLFMVAEISMVPPQNKHRHEPGCWWSASADRAQLLIASSVGGRTDWDQFSF